MTSGDALLAGATSPSVDEVVTGQAEPYDRAPSTTWSGSAGPHEGGAEYGRMVEALRLVQDRCTGAVPPDEVTAAVADQLEAVAEALAAHQVPERAQVAGRRLDLPGRGQAMSPAFVVNDWDDQHVRGRVVFRRFYLGGGGAAHGGVIPLLFDEVLGRLANTGGRARARTAYLNVDYRKITPIDVELVAEGRFEREEGRKRFLYGSLTDAEGTLLAEAHGLFVALRPGQP